jgi:hypothetical protein
MPIPTRVLTDANIDGLLETYTAKAEAVGDSIAGLKGVALLNSLKRGSVGVGPYPNVALFEAANRIMTDLVILHGVRWLLRNSGLPFDAYTVELGHENHGQHDIVAEARGKVLFAEVFNVAQSFFPIKKASALKKLRSSAVRSHYRVIVCNHDSVALGYIPKPRPGECFLFVDISSGSATVVPNIGLQPTADGASI